LLDSIEQFVDETALPDSRDTDERDELRRAFLSHANERLAQQRAFTLPAHERRTDLAQEVDAETGMRLDRFPHVNRLGLSFCFNGIVLAVVDRVARRAIRRLGDEDPVHRCRGLQACRGVYHVA